MSDLPISVPPSNQYGQAVKLEEAQQAVPMAPPPGPAGPTSPGGGDGGPMAPTGGPVEPAVEPGQFGPLNAPTERPDEPVTSGAPLGAGPGPEALTMTPRRRGEDLLRRAAAETADPLLTGLVERLTRRGTRP